MKKENKLDYDSPSIQTIIMEQLMQTTFSGQHNPGSSNTGGGAIGDAKGNNFFFDEEENDEN